MIWRYDPSEYSRSEVLQRNEFLKAISGTATKAGPALLGAGLYRGFSEAVDQHTFFWCLIGTLITMFGVLVVLLVEAD